jgi:hypothetical protein
MRISGSSSASSTAAGQITAASQLSGTSSASSIALGFVSSISQLAGSAAASASITGQMFVLARIVGLADAAGFASALLSVGTQVENELLVGAISKVAVPLFVATVGADVYVAVPAEALYGVQVAVMDPLQSMVHLPTEHKVVVSLQEPIAVVEGDE